MKAYRERAVVFLDRDGTINEEVEYLSDPHDFRLLPGAGQAIRHFNEVGWAVVVITNQSGIGRGYFTWERLEAIHQRMLEDLAAVGAWLDGLYVCPHRPDEGCKCRKPETGLFEQALLALGLTLPPCVAIGDKMTDLEPGRKLGCTTVLVLTGHGARELENQATWPFEPDAILPDLDAAADRFLHWKKEALPCPRLAPGTSRAHGAVS